MSEHVNELLSAHLDGELTRSEAAAVDAHLGECAACRNELEGTRVVRAMVRAAPAIDPPFGFYERLLRPHRRRQWPLAASAVAVAAVSIAVLGLAVTPERAKVVPPVAAARASLTNSSRIEVSVLDAKVDWSHLQGGLRSPIRGLPGVPWESTASAGPKALVYETDDAAVMVVGDVPVDQLEQAARDAGSRTGESFVDHLRDAASAVMDGFSLR